MRYIIFIVLIINQSCRRLVEIPLPPQFITSEKAFLSDGGAVAALVGIYSEMASVQNTIFNGGVTLYTGLAADELINFSPGLRDEFFHNEITAANHGTLETVFWNAAYKQIYVINACLEMANRSPVLSTDVKKMVTGEAKFLRAFTYFHLTELFGDVPLVTTTGYAVNSGLKRTPTLQVFEQIIRDLNDATGMLPDAYPSNEKTRANKWTALALLSRVNLYLGNWSAAEQDASAVINQHYHLVDDLNQVFLKNSAEAIWQFQSVNPKFATFEGYTILPATGNSRPNYLISETLYHSFEEGDERKTAWIKERNYLGQTVVYPYKYKVSGSNPTASEYYTVFRLAEQYLIRAEANARLNHLAAAASDVNLVRQRAGLLPIQLASVEEALKAIEKERRAELFAEWGHRWFDLRRYGRADQVLALKGSTWQSTDVLWPIPQNQILLNPNLVQNAGY